MHLTRSLLLFVSILSLFACVHSPPPEPVVVELVEVKARPDPEVERQRRREQLRQLLARAQQALAADRLMTPFPGSAYYWYQRALTLDFSAKEAHWGMRQITARYFELAEQAAAAGDVARAELMLDRSLQVSADAEQVKELRARYRQAVVVAGNEFRLKLKDLTARNKTMVIYLKGLAQQAMLSGSRLTITARNDNEGRWIYRQMREGVGGYRLRGNIEIGRIPRVLLIDLES